MKATIATLFAAILLVSAQAAADGTSAEVRDVQANRRRQGRLTPAEIVDLQLKARQGDVRAQTLLGRCLYWGIGVSQNRKEAAEWFRKASEQGDAEGQRLLGMCYDYGDGVPENEAEAVKWYRNAAEQGDAEAQLQLGVCYVLGKGVGKDKQQALTWLRKAAEQGHQGAQELLLLYTARQ